MLSLPFTTPSRQQRRPAPALPLTNPPSRAQRHRLAPREAGGCGPPPAGPRRRGAGGWARRSRSSRQSRGARGRCGGGRSSNSSSSGWAGEMQPKLLRSSHYIELGGYQYWPVMVPRAIRLYTYEQIPGFLRDNPYITDGYRAYLPSRLCIKRWAGQGTSDTPWTPPRAALPAPALLPFIFFFFFFLPAASSSSPTRPSTSGATCSASCSSWRWVSTTWWPSCRRRVPPERTSSSASSASSASR